MLKNFLRKLIINFHNGVIYGNLENIGNAYKSGRLVKKKSLRLESDGKSDIWDYRPITVGLSVNQCQAQRSRNLVCKNNSVYILNVF